MNYDQKGKLCLDKTIKLSREIINGEKEIVNPSITINRELGEAKTFCMDNNAIEVPIEHIGLAELAYKFATKTFFTKKINENGEEEVVFEALPKGAYISDFLDSCTPDVLAWPVKDGQPYKFDYHNTNKVYREDFTKYDKIYSKSLFDCGERAYTLSGVMDCVMQEYIKHAQENNIDIYKDKTEFWFGEFSNFINKLYNLQAQAENTVSFPKLENESCIEDEECQ